MFKSPFLIYFVSFLVFLPLFNFPNSGCGLSANVAYTPVPRYSPVHHLFLVFIWRNHILKFNITFSCEVLVSSGKRPYRNLTFYNVLAQQVFSFL